MRAVTIGVKTANASYILRAFAAAGWHIAKIHSLAPELGMIGVNSSVKYANAYARTSNIGSPGRSRARPIGPWVLRRLRSAISSFSSQRSFTFVPVVENDFEMTISRIQNLVDFFFIFQSDRHSSDK